MGVDNDYAPDGARAREMDRRVRESLADSIATVLDEWGDDSGVSDARAASFLRTVRDAPVSPGVFGIYTDLIEALSTGDRSRGRVLVERLLEVPPPRATFRIATLEDRDLGPTQAERYGRLIGEAESVTLFAVSDEMKGRAGAVLADALGLIARASPAYAAEVQALIRDVVIVGHRLESESDGCFASATTFYLWGAILLDEACASDRLTLAVTLVHEVAHAHLFGLTLGAPFVENSDDERFGSPLRQDARPMEGVFHASFVLARMIDWSETVLANGAIGSGERAALMANVAGLRVKYADGRATIAAHARLTPRAASILADADERLGRQAARLAG